MAGSDRGPGTSSIASAELGFRPLYRQVRDALIRRLVDGVWLPGEPLPSEMQLAAEYDVSQGTIRKALNELSAEHLLVRRQGRGTFVARHDEDRILFQFFRIAPDSGSRVFPDSEVLSCVDGRATPAEQAALALAEDSRVVRIRRTRSIEDRPVIAETIVLPAALFPGLAGMEIPNNLYGLYATRFGVAVAVTREKLKAVAATPETAKTLGIAAGTPLLGIDRIALSLQNTPVEWRVSACLTDTLHYESDLR
jgi:GntR family transcriptional regulator